MAWCQVLDSRASDGMQQLSNWKRILKQLHSAYPCTSDAHVTGICTQARSGHMLLHACKFSQLAWPNIWNMTTTVRSFSFHPRSLTCSSPAVIVCMISCTSMCHDMTECTAQCMQAGTGQTEILNACRLGILFLPKALSDQCLQLQLHTCLRLQMCASIYMDDPHQQICV